MKKRMLAMLFAMMMLAGCGGNAEAPAEQEQAQEQEIQITEIIEDDKAYAFLAEQPEEISVEDAAAKGFYTICKGEVQNQQVWDDFMAACERGEEAEVVLCQYTAKDGAVLDYVTHHADGSFEVVTDATRDGYFDEKSVMTPAETYTTLTLLENFTLEEGGKVHTIGVLSNKPDLTADDFRQSWIDLKIEEDNFYMLFVY